MAVARRSVLFLIAFYAPAVLCGPLLTPNAKYRYGVVHVRKKRSVQSKILDRIQYGQRIRCRETCQASGDWLPVITANNQNGWMHKAHVHLATPSEIGFTIRFLDVGNGNAAILTVGKKSIIIDGGTDSAFLKHYLHYKDIAADIPVVIVTSMDDDHFKGLSFLANRPTKHIRDYWGPVVTNPADEYGRFVAGLKRSGFRIATAPTPQCRRVGSKDDCDIPYVAMPPAVPEADITILHTNACPDDSRKQLERESLVVRIDVADQRFLFTGDIYGKDEDEIADMPPHGSEGHLVQIARTSRAEPGPLAATVLVVPDHGADTASTTLFIKSVRPKFAIFSAEPEYNSPKPAVIDRYVQRHAEVLRTDLDRRPGNDSIICTHLIGRTPADLSEPLRCAYEDTHSRPTRHRRPPSHP